MLICAGKQAHHGAEVERKEGKGQERRQLRALARSWLESGTTHSLFFLQELLEPFQYNSAAHGRPDVKFRAGEKFFASPGRAHEALSSTEYSPFQQAVADGRWDRPVEALPDASQWPTWGALRERILSSAVQVRREPYCSSGVG